MSGYVRFDAPVNNFPRQPATEPALEEYVEGTFGASAHDLSRKITAITASPEVERLRAALAEDAALLHHYVHPDISFEDCDGARCVRRRAALAGSDR